MSSTLLCAIPLWAVAIAGGDVAPRRESRPDEMTNATAVERVAPQFPVLPLRARVSATVSVEVDVSADGHPFSAKGNVTSSNMPSLSSELAAMFEGAAEAAAIKWRFASAPPDTAERRVAVTFVFTAKQNDGPVENNEQKAQRDVVVKGPLTLEVVEAPSVCYTPGERTVK